MNMAINPQPATGEWAADLDELAAARVVFYRAINDAIDLPAGHRLFSAAEIDALSPDWRR